MRERSEDPMGFGPLVSTVPERCTPTPSRSVHGTSALGQALILVCLIAAIDPQLSHAAEWSSLGLEGRLVNSLSQSGVWLYAGTDNGIFRTDLTAEEGWVALGLEGENVSSIYIEPNIPDTMYASIELATQPLPPPDIVTLYKSTDGGSNWAPSDSGMHGRSIHTLQGRGDDPAIIYASGNRLSRSEDGGFSWNQIDTGHGGGWAFAAAPSDPDVLYLGGSGIGENAVLQRSTDRGENWKSIISLPFGTIASLLVDPDDADIVYGGMGEQIYRSVDGGENYDIVPVGPAVIVSLSLDPLNSNRVYAGGGRPFVFRLFESSDAGETWIEIEGPEGARSISSMVLVRTELNALYVGTAETGIFKMDLAEQPTAIDEIDWSAFGSR